MRSSTSWSTARTSTTRRSGQSARFRKNELPSHRAFVRGGSSPPRAPLGPLGVIYSPPRCDVGISSTGSTFDSVEVLGAQIDRRFRFASSCDRLPEEGGG